MVCVNRRTALKEAERERLRNGRQLVFTRLALSQERAAAELDEQRRRTEARLQLVRTSTENERWGTGFASCVCTASGLDALGNGCGVVPPCF